jgi:uncharacterized protein
MNDALLLRIAEALERLSPPLPLVPDFTLAEAFVWNGKALNPVKKVNRVDLNLLKGIDLVKEQLLENTLKFARGLPSNNALLWGARGMGKSSLVKAVAAKAGVKLVEIHREDIGSLPELMRILGDAPHQFILFCDDLSFDAGETSYKSLKAVLEGGVDGRPENVILYATSNRRHILSRDMIENERSSAIHSSEAVEEKVSLSDRFGLWLGFHRASQDDYLEMVDSYAAHFGIAANHFEALQWANTRGARSGRVAWQYIQNSIVAV